MAGSTASDAKQLSGESVQGPAVAYGQTTCAHPAQHGSRVPRLKRARLTRVGVVRTDDAARLRGRGRNRHGPSPRAMSGLENDGKLRRLTC